MGEMTRLSEHQALEICIVRSLEQAAATGGLWAVGDAKAATDAAVELTGTGASFSEMLSRRARLAIERIAQRSPDNAIRIREGHATALAAWLLCAIAFAAGCMTDYLASNRQVDVIEYGLLGLIVWNLIVFLVLLVGTVVSALSRRQRQPGPLAGFVGRAWFASAVGLRFLRKRPWLVACQQDWVERSRALARARVNLAFHAAAICFAAGAVAMLYLRGLPTQYEPGVPGSTWLDTALTQDLFRWVVTPGARLFGLPVPDIQAVAGAPTSADSLAVARTLFHLHAASVVAWILLPRSLLVLANAGKLWRLRRAFPLPLTSAYFTALRAAWRRQRIAVVVVPFRYQMPPRTRMNLQMLLERTYGMSVDIEVQDSVLMGDDPMDWKRVLNKEGHVAVLPVFNVVATAEADVHGALLTRLRQAVEAETPVVPIVDVSAFPVGMEERLRTRQRQWRQMLDRVRADPLFVDLARGDEQDLALLRGRLNRDG